jgi:nucleotide-binding universal stress UspA family protein
MNEREQQLPTETVSAVSAAMQRADTANGEGPGEERPSGALRVLVAVDDSDTSVRAARTAHQLFGDTAAYFVINVGAGQRLWAGDPMTWGVAYPLASVEVGIVAMPVRAGTMYESGLPSAVDQAQAEARSVSAAAELPTDSVAVGSTGDPAEQIRQVADDESIDVIVVGWGDGGWWRHMIEPSVSKAVVRQADRPVLVVP